MAKAKKYIGAVRVQEWRRAIERSDATSLVSMFSVIIGDSDGAKNVAEFNRRVAESLKIQLDNCVLEVERKRRERIENKHDGFGQPIDKSIVRRCSKCGCTDGNFTTIASGSLCDDCV